MVSKNFEYQASYIRIVSLIKNKYTSSRQPSPSTAARKVTLRCCGSIFRFTFSSNSRCNCLVNWLKTAINRIARKPSLRLIKYAYRREKKTNCKLDKQDLSATVGSGLFKTEPGRLWYNFRRLIFYSFLYLKNVLQRFNTHGAIKRTVIFCVYSRRFPFHVIITFCGYLWETEAES